MGAACGLVDDGVLPKMTSTLPASSAILTRPASPTFNPIIRFGIARLQGDVDNTTDF